MQQHTIFSVSLFVRHATYPRVLYSVSPTLECSCFFFIMLEAEVLKGWTRKNRKIDEKAKVVTSRLFISSLVAWPIFFRVPN